MTKTRSQGKQDRSGSDDSQNSGSGSGSDQTQGGGGGCVPTVRRMIDKYSTPRRGTARFPATPGSTTRRVAPPMSATRSVSRPGTASKATGDFNRHMALFKDSDPVEVYCRIKPLVGEDQSCIRILDDTSLALIPPESSVAFKLGTAKESHYSFQRVFGSDATQKRIFDEISLPLVKDFLQGKNALLFAYGVTGSGKTYTMAGNASDSGVMPRCLDVVFNSIGKHKALKYVFKPDRMNGFEAQSKADAMQERQRELHEKQRETSKTPRKTGRAPMSEYGMDQYLSRVRDETVLPIGNEDSLYSVFVTYVEIYNNAVYDLLDESPIDIMKTKLQHKLLREDVSHNVYVNGVTEVEVESPEDAFAVYLRGQRRRKMAHTALNTESSRSHAIFNIRLVQAPLDAEGEEVVEDNKLINVSQLSLVDLAGSERHTRTQASGDRLKEAGNINNSLMTLRQCMDILRENQKFSSNRVVPYRDSKLTHFLKNYFDGEGRVRMILCVNPKNEDYDENLHVMAFAELTQEVQIVRPQEKKLDPLTPHRAKANKLYKEAKKQLVQEKVIEEYQLPTSDVGMVFGLGIPIPLCKISKSTEEEVLVTLKKALELRAKGKAELSNFINEKRQAFRLRLTGIEREMEALRSENGTLRSHVERINSEKEKLDNVLRATLYEKTDLEGKYKQQEETIKSLEDELLLVKQELRQKTVNHQKKMQMMQGDAEVQRKLDERKSIRIIEKEKAKLQDEFRTKEKTIEAVRELVSVLEPPSARTRNSKSRTSRNIAALDLSTTTSSESDLPVVLAKVEPKASRSRYLSTPVLHESVQVNIPNSGRRNALLSSQPRHGRARSTDRELWVEHTDRAVVYKPQTVFQPVMKKKKSLNKLTSVDDVKGASKYCLLTQEPDSDGDIQTKLYKGEINPTISGGANMVLRDVESLKQLSPGGQSPRRKRLSTSPGPVRTRRSRGMLNGENDELPYETIVDRCRQGIAGVDSKTNHRTE